MDLDIRFSRVQSYLLDLDTSGAVPDAGALLGIDDSVGTATGCVTVVTVVGDAVPAVESFTARGGGADGEDRRS